MTCRGYCPLGKLCATTARRTTSIIPRATPRPSSTMWRRREHRLCGRMGGSKPGRTASFQPLAHRTGRPSCGRASVAEQVYLQLHALAGRGAQNRGGRGAVGCPGVGERRGVDRSDGEHQRASLPGLGCGAFRKAHAMGLLATLPKSDFGDRPHIRGAYATPRSREPAQRIAAQPAAAAAARQARPRNPLLRCATRPDTRGLPRNRGKRLERKARHCPRMS